MSLPVDQAVVLSDAPPCPLNAHHGQASVTNLGPVDLSSDYLEFSRVLCNRLSSFFKCNPQFPLMSLTPLLAPNAPSHHQYRHLTVKSGTTAGQHDMSSACGSGCCFVRCTPIPSCPLNAPRERHLVAKSSTKVQLT